MKNKPDWITKLKLGDRDTFREFVEEYKNKVLNTCYNFVRNVHDAEDVSQEVFIEIFNSIHKFKNNSQIGTWVYRITVSKCLDFLRKKNQKKRKVQILSIFGIKDFEHEIESQAPQTPAEILESDDQTQIILSQIGKLPDNQRAALTLNKLENLSIREIAEILQTSETAVESLLQRAKANLKKKLSKIFDS